MYFYSEGLDMRYLTFRSIRKNLALLIVLAVFPALAILFYSGVEQRRQSIQKAKQDILLLVHTMAVAEKETTRSTRQILSTLSLLSAIQNLDIPVSNEILGAVLRHNPQYNNIALVGLDGEVLTAGKYLSETNLADRKHFQEAFKRKKFAVGEYIISRVGTTVPAFAYAYPVLNKEGTFKAILTCAVKLTSLAHFHDVATLPENSFVGLTDHRGIRLVYYPAQKGSHPVGTKIREKNWQIASKTEAPGIFIGTGSDGVRRIFAFEQVRLTPDDAPYLYLWAGIPEDNVTGPANATLTRNVLLMLLATIMSLGFSWVLGKTTLVSPLKNLVSLTRKFARGNLQARVETMPTTGELELLTTAFHEMAEALVLSQKSLQENESRFRLLMDSVDALIYVADMTTYEVLFVNEYAKKQLGDVTGKKCWQSIQQGQSGPCPFCSNKYLLTEKGEPGELYKSEFQNTVTGRWLYMRDRAIQWIDGRIVKMQIATDFTERKKIEDEREQLIDQLQKALAKIKILSGFLPICASCKKIRDDRGYWNKIETYIQNHSEAEFSHSICPDCAEKLYPELYPKKKDE